MFFYKSKISRVAQYLKDLLAKQCQEHWANYLIFSPSSELIKYEKHLGEEIKIQEIFSTFALFREKAHFPWRPRSVGSNEKSLFLLLNTEVQYIYFSKLLKISCLINEELQKKAPNYKLIIDYAKSIQKEPGYIISPVNGFSKPFNVCETDVPLNHSINFNHAIVGMTHSCLFAVLGAFSIPFYCLNYSKYCGSPHFFMDVVLHLFTSAQKMLWIPALEKAYWNYMTITCEPNIKNDIRHCLESIILLAEKHNNAADCTNNSNYNLISDLD